jgi:hypothetical protein
MVVLTKIKATQTFLLEVISPGADWSRREASCQFKILRWPQCSNRRPNFSR